MTDRENRKIASITIVLFVIFGFLLVFNFKCNKDNTIVNTDNTVKQYEIKIRTLEDSVKYLNTLLDSNKLKVILLDKKILSLSNGYNVIIEKIKKLPIDESIIMAQDNFIDSSEIKKIVLDSEIRVSISEKQLIECNTSFAENGFLKETNSILEEQIGLMNSNDSIYNKVISSKDSIISFKDKIIENKDNSILNIEDSLKYTRRKLFYSKVKQCAMFAVIVTMVIFSVR